MLIIELETFLFTDLNKNYYVELIFIRNLQFSNSVIMNIIGAIYAVE